MIPFHIKIMSNLIAVRRGGELPNFSNGEVEKFDWTSGQVMSFNKDLVICQDGFFSVWKYISNNYFKCVAKYRDRGC